MSESGICGPEGSMDSISAKERKGNKQLYGCHVCGKKLSRIAHLRRHQLQHSSAKERFQCYICKKNFNRKDVYQRHLRLVHDPKQAGQKKRSKKSCQRCIRYKLKCSREIPCTLCRSKNTSCIYESLSSSSVPEPAIQTQSCIMTDSSFDAMGKGCDFTHHDQQAAVSQETGHDGSYFPSPTSSTQSTDGTVVPPNPLQPGHPEEPGSAFLQAEIPRQPLDIVSQGYSQAFLSQFEPHGSSLQLPEEFIESTNNDENYEWLDGISLDLEEFNGSMFRASKMDWLGCAADFSDCHTSILTPATGESQALCNEMSSNGEDLTNHVLYPIQDPIPLQGNEQLPRGDCDTSGNPDRESWPGVLDRGGNESWPFDYTSNKGFRKIKLPPLREILQQTVGNRPFIKADKVKNLIEALSTPFIPSLGEITAREVFPTITFLGELVRVYFAEFHPAFPIVHAPTWKIEKCPNALLAAMACIGATHSTDPEYQSVAPLLAEINQRTLFWMGQCDSRSYRNPVYIASSCLHQIYALGSGNRRLYELADASRGLLVTGLRELGVLSSDADKQENNITNPRDLKTMNSSALEDSWNRWRDTELERRIAWSVFEFDCTLSTLTRKRGAFSMSELPTRLPCSENLWDALSSNAWASVINFSTSSPGGLPFYPLLRHLISQKSMPSATPAWAKRICALVISRLLWDLREMEEISSSKVFGLSSLVDVHKATRDNLLSSLSAVSVSLSEPACVNDIFNMNVACLATHYAHLNCDETMDLVTFIFRNNYALKSNSSDTQLHKELSRARTHLQLRFTRHPVATRRSVYHAIKIVSLSQKCTSFTPCETMRVFFSFALLLAFVRFFPFDEASTTSGNALPVRLDDLPLRQSHTKLDPVMVGLERWIEKGGVASFGSVYNICDRGNFDVVKQDALSVMDHLRVWGLARKFYRVLQNFNDND